MPALQRYNALPRRGTVRFTARLAAAALHRDCQLLFFGVLHWCMLSCVLASRSVPPCTEQLFFASLFRQQAACAT